MAFNFVQHFHSTSSLLATINKDYYFEDLNPAWETITRQRREHFRHNPFYCYFANHNHKVLITYTDQLFNRQQNSVDITLDLLSSINQYIPLQANLFFSTKDQQIYFSGQQTSSITQNQPQLLEIQSAFRGAFESSAIGMAIVSIKGEFTRVNQSLINMTGYSEQDFSRLTFQEITHPDDLNADLTLMNQLLEGQINNYQLEKRYYHKGGQLIWILLSVSLVKNSLGKPLYFIAQIQDITSIRSHNQLLEQSNQKLNKYLQAIDAASDIIIITDPEGQIYYVNPAIETILGYIPHDCIGSKPQQIWGGEMSTKFYQHLWETIKVNKQPFTGRLQNRHADGHLVDTELKIQPLLNASGDIEYFVAIQRDISETQQIDRMKSEFISLASHQLRTPATSIKWNLEVLTEKILPTKDPEITTIMDQLISSNAEMIKITNALLNISKIELGKIQIKPVKTHLHTWFKSIIQELKAQSHPKGINITLNLDPEDMTVPVDPSLLRQVIVNLLTNAIKYSPIQTSITINCSQTAQNLLIEIIDQGYGIPENQLPKIFNKFFRGSNTSLKDTKGNGLGLYLVKLIVDSYQGTIQVDSQINQGTKFSLSLPTKLCSG